MALVKFCHILENSNFNRLFYNSIKNSDRTKIEYTVISLEPEGELQKQMRELGVDSFSIDYTSRKQAPQAVWKLFRFLRRARIQIVQTHLFDASLIGLTAARLARVPVTIFTGHHSHEVPLYKRPLLTFVDGLNGRLLATNTIAPSQDMKDIFIENQKIPARKIDVVHHGFDLEKLRAQSGEVSSIKKELGIEDKIVFGAIGRLFWVKNFENLIDAFTQAAEKRDDLALLIVGEGRDKEKLRELIKAKGMERHIFLTGARKDIAAVINSFDVFIHSALAESFGMVFIEAFALGKPIISTRVGIAADVVEDGVNGFLVETGNPEELAGAIEKMLEKRSDWRQMGMRAKAIADEFAVERTQVLCDDLYLKWLGEK